MTAISSIGSHVPPPQVQADRAPPKAADPDHDGDNDAKPGARPEASESSRRLNVQA